MKAEYIDHMGSDLTVVNAARVSFDKESQWEKNPKRKLQWGEISSKEGAIKVYKERMEKWLSEKDTKLIQYLASHNHWTPFGHPTITIRETVPIFVARQRFKHMVGFVYNEVSRRYVEDDPEYYVPLRWRKRADNKKQGSLNEVIELNSHATKEVVQHFKMSTITYNELLKAGVAPEQARMVLPQSMYTSYYCTGSLAAWARAYKLRIDAHAQVEIQDLAKQWGKIIEPLFPVSWKALTQGEK